jgi:hypothetical protein
MTEKKKPGPKPRPVSETKHIIKTARLTDARLEEIEKEYGTFQRYADGKGWAYRSISEREHDES